MSEVNAAMAMARADAAHDKIEGHEDLCAERYAHIHAAVDGVKQTVGTILKILAWGGSTIFGLLVLVLGFLGSRAITSNDDQVNRLENQIEQMRRAQPAVMPKPVKPSPLS